MKVCFIFNLHQIYVNQYILEFRINKSYTLKENIQLVQILQYKGTPIGISMRYPMFQSNLTNDVNFKIDVNANVTDKFKCTISIGSKYRLEKIVSYGVCKKGCVFCLVINVLRFGKKKTRTFQRFIRFNFQRIFNRKRALTDLKKLTN